METVNLLAEPQAMSNIVAELQKLEAEDSKARVLEYVNKVFNFKNTNTSLLVNQTRIEASESNSGVTQDPMEFWEEKNPQNNYEKIAIVAYYTEKIKGVKEYSKENLIKSWDEDFNQTLPSDQVFTNALNDTISKYQYLISKKGILRLNVRGTNLVKGLPNPDETLRGTIRRAKPKSKANAKKK